MYRELVKNSVQIDLGNNYLNFFFKNNLDFREKHYYVFYLRFMQNRLTIFAKIRKQTDLWMATLDLVFKKI